MEWSKGQVKNILANGNYSNGELFSDISKTINLIESSNILKEKYWDQIFLIMTTWSNDFSGQTYKQLHLDLSKIRLAITNELANINSKKERLIKKTEKIKIIKNTAIKISIWLLGIIIAATITTLISLSIGGHI